MGGERTACVLWCAKNAVQWAGQLCSGRGSMQVPMPHPPASNPARPPFLRTPAPLPCVPPALPACQVAVIRQVEVDIKAEMESLAASHKEERGKAKLWAAEAKKAAAQIAERDGAPPRAAAALLEQGRALGGCCACHPYLRRCCAPSRLRLTGAVLTQPRMFAGTEPAPLSAEELAQLDVKEVDYQITMLNQEMDAMEVRAAGVAGAAGAAGQREGLGGRRHAGGEQARAAPPSPPSQPAAALLTCCPRTPRT